MLNNTQSQSQSNKKDWSFRYGRNGAVRNYIINEDEEMFKEHVEQMRKKQSNYYYLKI